MRNSIFLILLVAVLIAGVQEIANTPVSISATQVETAEKGFQDASGRLWGCLLTKADCVHEGAEFLDARRNLETAAISARRAGRISSQRLREIGRAVVSPI